MGLLVPSHDAGGRAKPRWPDDSEVTARFSPCEQYRWWLLEKWNQHPLAPLVAWLMMNPSVANIDHADPTLIHTGKFSRSWGYGGQIIVNMHAYRATDSKRLLDVADPVGIENDASILRAALQSDMMILAYGQPPRPLRPRATQVVQFLRASGAHLAYLRLSKDGTPQHPLYLPGNLLPQDFV